MFNLNQIKEKLQGFAGIKSALHSGDTLVVDIEGTSAQLVLCLGDLLVTGPEIQVFRHLDTAAALAKSLSVIKTLAVMPKSLAEILAPDAALDALLARQVA